jgi:hypothetical protein
MRSQTAPSLPAAPFRESSAAELVFHGVEQAGPSFEGRVFLNNENADETTPLTAEAGYGGSFHVYGYGEPLPPATAAARESATGAVAPIDKRVTADPDALRVALERAEGITVTVVAVPVDPGGPLPDRAFEDVEAVFDRAARG